AGDLTTVIAPDGSRNGTQYDAWGKAICTTQGGLTRSMEYDAAGRVIRLTSENGSHTTFRYDVLDRLIQETGFDGRTQRYHHDLTGKLIRSEDEGLVTHWHYDEADRLTHRTVNGETAERWQYDERGWLTDISHISEGHRYDRHGRLTEKTDLIPEGVIRTDDERTHRYHYDSQHRLVHYTRTQYAEPLVESRYLYDPLGRRVAKRVWRRERDLTGWMSLSRKPQVTWYGWDGDRLTTIQNDRTRIQTIYQPGSFTPLIRVETATGELAKTQHRSLADTLQQSGGEDGGSVVFPPVLVQMLDRLESEILADRVSEESRRWLASCGLTVAQMQSQMDPVYTPARKIHLYHCDHRGLPLALISTEGTTAWYAEYDEWGNLLNEENPHQLQQLIRLPGQQYDEESGLYYNRHRYYDPLQGRYITQDPIGLKGGWNFYQYPLNPISNIDPLGLETLKCIKPLHSMGGTGERSGPDIWGNPFYHQYLCVPDGKGDYTCGGQDQRGESKGDGLWGPGKASNDTKEAAGRCDLVETDNSCVENCLKGKFKEVRPRYSVLPDIFTPINLGLFKNCQDWSNDSLETCKMKCSGNNIGRFIRFVFTGVM
ncbi:TPA: RHS repeat protein, partial [Escherichia coli]|nr:RHS repeat protein [Escherichia coli]EIA1296131.1 RHS repeat protein [Escherichia coli]HCK1129177.1 RHS repeat protein [Escherichia coli]